MDREPTPGEGRDPGGVPPDRLIEEVLDQRRDAAPESDSILPDAPTGETDLRKPPRHSRITEAAKRLGHDLWSERTPLTRRGRKKRDGRSSGRP